MARYRKIDTRIWNDQKFNKLSYDAQFLFIFLLTHPHLTALGAMRSSLQGLAGELRWDLKKFQRAFFQLITEKMVKHDEKFLFIWLPNFLKYNQPESPNVVKSWEQSLDYLPECKLKNELIIHIKILIGSLSLSFKEALPEAFRKSMPNQEQEQEHKQEQEQTTYCSEQSLQADEGNAIQLIDTKILISVPLHNQTEFEITKNQIEEWNTLFPAINVMQELRNIRAWNLANPKRRKTKSGILKHIVGWLSKAQDRGETFASRSRQNYSSGLTPIQEFNQASAAQWLQESEAIIIEGEINP